MWRRAISRALVGSVSSTTACSTHSSGSVPERLAGHRGVLDRHEVGVGAAGAVAASSSIFGPERGQQPERRVVGSAAMNSEASMASR